MTNDEVKKKIIETLKNTVVNYDCGHAIIAGYFYMEKVFVAFADALIAAGIGDVKAAEHRAEVAERALELCEIAYILALNGKQHEGISQQAIVSDLGVHKFFIEQAEKELLEDEE